MRTPSAFVSDLGRFPAFVEDGCTKALGHGPLSAASFPDADVPVAQITVPAGWAPRRIVEVGRAALSHNLRLMKLGERGERDPWALKFDKWLTERLDAWDLDALAVPTTEHFDPLFFALGAAGLDRPAHFYHAVEHGSAIMRAFALGAGVPAARG